MLRIAQVTMAVCTGLLLAGCQKPPAPEAGTVAAAEGPAAAESAEEKTQDNTRAGGISRLLQANSIGATKAFVERTLGQSTYETEHEASYRVDGCEVTLGLDGNSVGSVSIALAPGCRFDVAGLVDSPQPVVIDGTISFAQFEAVFGQARYTSPCLMLCGNAYDPYLDAVVQGSRADGFIDIAAHVLFVDDAVLDATTRWQEQLTAMAGEDYVMSTKFNCDASHDSIARAAFATVPVEKITFGSGLGTWDCP